MSFFFTRPWNGLRQVKPAVCHQHDFVERFSTQNFPKNSEETHTKLILPLLLNQHISHQECVTVSVCVSSSIF